MRGILQCVSWHTVRRDRREIQFQYLESDYSGITIEVLFEEAVC